MTICDLGCIHVYIGYGKNKTAAAIGNALLSLGKSQKVGFFFFNKEKFGAAQKKILDALAYYGLRYEVSEISYSCEADHSIPITQSVISEAHRMLSLAKKATDSGKYDLIVLDHIHEIVSHGIISESDFLQFLRSKPSHIEMILTGEKALESVKGLARDVTEMK
ncbi:MAG: cob(I)yrinic acid a,c-diamide adenosyltransferase [Parcubacteria group bacterium]|nr:cob(I)yrinic acid a,c-diamide adenosyltransferase [Parcubacteria group bacterium]